jgi:uncharacterized cofD-like protein
MRRELNVVTLGGGSAHAQILLGLANYPYRITAICTAADSGGASGELANTYGKSHVNGYLGDVSKCCGALSSHRDLVGDLDYRFAGTKLENLSLRTLLYAGLILRNGPAVALEKLHNHLRVDPWHRAMPVSFKKTNLQVRLQGGQVLSGEAYIDNISRNQLWNPQHHKIVDVWLKPQVQALPEALRAITQADVIIVAPGDLFTSCIPVLLADGVARAVKRSKAKLIFVLSLMTKLGETDGYHAADFVQELTRRTMGRYPDFVLANNNGIPPALLRRYRRKEHKVAVIPDHLDDAKFRRIKLIRSDLWNATTEGQIVHDPAKTASALSELINSF